MHHGPTNFRTRLFTIDSRGETYPTRRLDGRLSFGVAEAERYRAPAEQARGVPRGLLSGQGRDVALERLKEGFPADLPFSDPLFERGCVCGACSAICSP